MTRLLELIFAILIVLVLFLGIALFLPSRGHVVRKAEIPNPPVQVFDYLNTHRNHLNWSPWSALDKAAQWERTGADAGQGAKVAWQSYEKSLGNGSMEIVKSIPNEEIVYKLDNNWQGKNKTSTFKIEQHPKTNATELTWIIDVEYGWNLFSRYAGLYLNGGVGEFMNIGLNRLNARFAQLPVSDYSQYQVSELDLPERDFVYIGVKVPSKPSKWNTEAEPAIYKAIEEVNAFVIGNKLEAAGLPVAQINLLGDENHEFSVGVPVTPGAVITPTGNVRVGKLPATTAVKLVYPRGRQSLNRARDLVKAFAMSHGYKFDYDMTGLLEEVDNTGSAVITNEILPVQKL